MKTEDFDFNLPEHLIAQHPPKQRGDSRLLHFSKATEQIEHTEFQTLVDRLRPNDLLVLNNTRVIPARLYGQKETGGKVELLIERIISENTCIAHIKASKAPKPGRYIVLDKHYKLMVQDKNEGTYTCELQGNQRLEEVLEEIGHIPLPPYITREDDSHDAKRYQTVYGVHNGSVAAPTAGLHFDEAMLERLKAKGIQIAYVTLHVGAGTFQPVRVETLAEHKMHYERYQIDNSLCEAIEKTKQNNGRVIAVGTTSLRTLESAARMGKLQPHSGDTNLFIYPGYSFKVCDGLITNFHLPKSTLLMLVAAFIGHEQVMNLYQTAVQEEYRFFSYGDATLLL